MAEEKKNSRRRRGPSLKETPDPSTREGRLTQAIQRYGSARQLHLATGISESMIGKYQKPGADWKPSKIEEISRELGVSVEWLWTGETKLSSSVAVVYYDARASAGFGRTCEESVGHPIQFPRSFLTDELGLQPSGLIMITADGDSMLPTIHSGDRLLVDTQPSTRIEGVYAVVMHGGLFVKRISRTANGDFLVQSDNPAYQSATFPADQVSLGSPDGHAMTIIGRVVWTMQRV
ncbi:LexA family transcriptional regulator [Acetobacter aceti]|uniref:LexA family transcriptional regulator n=1 Tax=Acetobacter aceti TaxID=435 RepID=UPI000C07F702|nr:LexA family transcriptional regulator [Acetobacter aceti]